MFILVEWIVRFYGGQNAHLKLSFVDFFIYLHNSPATLDGQWHYGGSRHAGKLEATQMEFTHIVAAAAGAFRKNDHRMTGFDNFRTSLKRLNGFASAAPVYKNAGDFTHPMAEHGDFEEFLLGNKTGGNTNKAQHQRDIEHALMIADKTDIAMAGEIFGAGYSNSAACGEQRGSGP